MELKSSFEPNQTIHKKNTCEGDDLSPPLTIKNAPPNTASFAIIMDDPDAPSGVFIHWVAWNIPSAKMTLSEGEKAPKEGKNGFGSQGYRGPCPPKGKPHRYFFKVYALDEMLNLPEGSSRQQLESAMEGHILGKAELIGLYQR